MSNKKFNLSAAGNTEPPAFQLIKDMGFEMSKRSDLWIAEDSKSRFCVESPLELLGLISLYQAKGENWRVPDNKIDEFLEFDLNN